MSGAIIFLLACAGVLAFFSGAGTCVVFADRAALRRHARTGNRGARVLEAFLRRPQWSWTTAMVGARLALVVAVGVGCSSFFCPNPSWPAGGVALLGGVGILFLGRVLPELYFLPRANQSASWTLLALQLVFYPLSVLVLPLVALDALVQGVFGRGRERSPWLTRDELKLLLTNPSSRGFLDEEGRQMIDRIFEFSETTVEEAMIPLVSVDALADEVTAGEAATKIAHNLYSRYPVFHDRIDNIVGVLYTVDLMRSRPEESVAEKVRPPRYVPFNKPLDELLFEMQRDNFSLAVVVDEYGGCVGIITREDIIEEIIGEIEDEHDEPGPGWRKVDDSAFEVAATMPIDELNESLGLDLPEGDYDTLAGFLLFLFSRVPHAGESIRYRDLAFTVTKATARAVQEVRIEVRRLPQ